MGDSNVATGYSPVSFDPAYSSEQYGDYEGLAFYNGLVYPAWIDNSKSLQGNPDAAQPGSNVDVSTDLAVARINVISTPITTVASLRRWTPVPAR